MLGCDSIIYNKTILNVEDLVVNLDSQYIKTDVLAVELVTDNDIQAIEWFSLNPLSCDSCDYIEIKLENSELLTVLIEDVYGCTEFLELKIEAQVDLDTAYYIPNTFSAESIQPNNTFFVQSSVHNIGTSYAILIYDRWGNLVFENPSAKVNAQSDGWTGYMNGEKVEAGVYIYNIAIIKEDGIQNITGTITFLK